MIIGVRLISRQENVGEHFFAIHSLRVSVFQRHVRNTFLSVNCRYRT